MKQTKQPDAQQPPPQPASSDDEADYEATPRGALGDKAPRAAPLPIKGLDGRVRSPLDAPRRMAAVPAVAGVEVIDPAHDKEMSSEEEAPSKGMTKQEKRAARKKAAREAKRAPSGETPQQGLVKKQAFASREARQQAARLQMASAAQKLLSDPERNVGGLSTLNALLDDSDPVVCHA